MVIDFPIKDVQLMCNFHMFLDYAFPGNNPMARCNRTPSKKVTRTWRVETDDEDEPFDKLAYSAGEMARLATERKLYPDSAAIRRKPQNRGTVQVRKQAEGPDHA